MNVSLFLRMRGGESEVASIRYHLHYCVESSLAALLALFPLDEIEVPDIAVHAATEDDAEYRRLRERAQITRERVRDRISTEAAEHLEEALRAERERGERATLLVYRLALTAFSKADA